jgi:hypothetical protein
MKSIEKYEKNYIYGSGHVDGLESLRTDFGEI